MSFFSASPSPRPHRPAVSLLLCLGVAWLGFAVPRAHGALPPYLREALASFTPEVPAGWAYTVTTTQGERRTTERFDPAKPPAQQWTLLRLNDRAPTEKETAQYFKYKASQAPGAARGTYTRDDIEPFSLQLVHEDEHRAVFVGSFRAQSAGADKMLAHLQLRLVVSKAPAYVMKSSIELTEPYSPVLTVKMKALVASMEFSPPGDARPSLPARSSSHFQGRIFFFGVEENLDLAYEDFARIP